MLRYAELTGYAAINPWPWSQKSGPFHRRAGFAYDVTMDINGSHADLPVVREHGHVCMRCIQGLPSQCKLAGRQGTKEVCHV